MEKTTHVIIWGIIALAIGFIAGHLLWTQEVIKEVPKEVIVTKNVTIEVPSFAAYLGQAKSDFWEEVEDEESLHFCSGHEYAFEDISLAKTYTNYAVEHEDEDTYTVSFEAKLRYNEDSERDCFKNYEVSVLYDEDENPEVKVD